MSIFGLIILIVVLLVVMWLTVSYISPALPAPFGRVVTILAALLAILVLLSYAGAWGAARNRLGFAPLRMNPAEGSALLGMDHSRYMRGCDYVRLVR